MFKYLLLSVIASTCFCSENIIENKSESEWNDFQYIRVGSGNFVKKDHKYFSCAEIGMGTRWVIDEHIADLSTDILIHPSYQIISSALSYAYAPKSLWGLYAGPSVKIGTFIYDHAFCFSKKIVLQIPLVIGHSHVNEKGILSFVEAQIGIDGLLTVSSGIGF